MRHTETTRRAVIEDYRVGIPVKIIAERHGVGRETVRQYAREAGEGPRPSSGGTTKGYCTSCRGHLMLRNGICGTCAADIPLVGGRWVLDPVRRVQVWVEDEIA